jgi:regulator of protease activity HflC (stomatin/prohibitin superfamily)
MRLQTNRLNLPIAALSVASLGILIALARMITIIPTGNVGVVDLFGQIAQQPLDPGLHLKHPLARVIIFSTQTRELKEIVQTPSKEGLIVSADLSILYHLDAQKVRQLYQTVGTEYEQVILVPIFRSLIRNATASYDAIALYTVEKCYFTRQYPASGSSQDSGGARS